MKIDKIRIEKIKTWNKHKQKENKTTKNYKKGMKKNETRKGKYSKIILKENIILQKRRNQLKSRK